MTAQIEKRSNSYVSNGTTGPYAYTFTIHDTSWLTVKVDGEINTGYTIDEVAKEITFLGNITDGAEIFIYSSIPVNQLLNYIEYGAFSAESHERALDKLTYILQELSVNNAIRFPDEDTANRIIDDVAGRANKIFSFDSSGEMKFITPESAAPAANTASRNYLINPSFIVNQRGFFSGVSEDSKFYMVDRWKGADAASVVAFNGIQASITTGSMIQVVENMFHDGAFTLSWEGTSKLNGVQSSPYTFIPPAGDFAISFGIGTVSKPKLEIGSTVSAFEYPDRSTELVKCQRYYTLMTNNWITNEDINQTEPKYLYSELPTTMRTTPGLSVKSQTGSEFYPASYGGVHPNGFVVFGFTTNTGKYLRTMYLETHCDAELDGASASFNLTMGISGDEIGYEA